MQFEKYCLECHKATTLDAATVRLKANPEINAQVTIKTALVWTTDLNFGIFGICLLPLELYF